MYINSDRDTFSFLFSFFPLIKVFIFTSHCLYQVTNIELQTSISVHINGKTFVFISRNRPTDGKCVYHLTNFYLFGLSTTDVISAWCFHVREVPMAAFLQCCHTGMSSYGLETRHDSVTLWRHKAKLVLCFL